MRFFFSSLHAFHCSDEQCRALAALQGRCEGAATALAGVGDLNHMVGRMVDNSIISIMGGVKKKII